MATTPNICDICKLPKEAMQNKNIVLNLHRVLFGADREGDVPDVCMDCWQNIKMTHEKCWFPGHVAEMSRLIGEEHEKRVQAEYERLRDEYQRKEAACEAVCLGLRDEVAALNDELKILREAKQ